MPKTAIKEQEKIGFFIKKLREERGLTQEAFAKLLATSQSNIARMERGGQNFTLGELSRISEILERKLVSVSGGSIDFAIEGGRKLSGSVVTNTSKNGAVNMLAVCLVNRGKTTLHGMPKVEEVFRYIEILESLGVSVKWLGESTLEIIPPQKINIKNLNQDIAKKTRSFTFSGALLHHSKSFSFPHSGGCKMGERTIAAHKFGLEALGVTTVTKENRYDVSYKKLHSGEVIMYESSDTGAITILAAAARIPGKTVIKFAPPNYQVQDVCFLLEKMGVKIEGIGTTTLTVHGISDINVNVEHHNSEDPIEAMFFLAAAIVTDSTLTIKRVSINFLELEIEKLRRMGQKMKFGKRYLSENGRTELVDITLSPSKLKAPTDKLHTQPFPGLQNDSLPFFVPIVIKASGTTLIHDWTWENRAIYFTELNKLGAKITLADPHRVFIEGPTKLKGAQIICPPALRPSASIFIAMLGAEGTSILRNIYSISRGYADIAARLNSIGAKIEVLHN
jgi:UDP-N-acetylglucosamine 1-carboxyvinyltransferase